VADAPAWVLDTNVVVSGLLSPSGPPGRLVDALLGRRLRLAFDDRIEIEYRDVLARPRVAIEPARREAFLAVLQFQVHETAAPWPYPMPPDEDDVVFLEVALQTALRVVVTGRQRHFPPRCRGPVTVLSPRVALERLVGLDFSA
jgi:putative PIN family toxin of toxin-antitoxin system